jgi:hypothetical protein
MNEIYNILATLRDAYVGIALQYTNKKYEAEDAVQELYIYFLNMNKETLRQIYIKDGEDGLIRYGAVALRRSFTSPRSKFYYVYKKYNKNIDDSGNIVREDVKSDDLSAHNKKRINNMVYETNHTETWEYFEKIDKELDNMYWYDRQVYKLYYNVDKKETLDSLAKKTKISRNSLFTTLDNVRKKLKEILSDE